MKWITRERARVDRIACPWLITRFIDPKPEFLFVPASEVLAVAKREHAIPYDVPNVELGHHGPAVLVRRLHRAVRARRSRAGHARRASSGAPTPTTARSRRSPPASTPPPPASRRSAATTSTTWPVSSRCTTRSTSSARTTAAEHHARGCCSCACTAPPRAWSAPRTSAGWRRRGVSRSDAVAAGTEPDPELAPGAVKGPGRRGADAPPRLARAPSRSTTWTAPRGWSASAATSHPARGSVSISGRSRL